MKGKSISELEVGQQASLTKTITKTDVINYAGITGDFNPVHVNKEYAQESIFKGRIAHGMLGAGLISAVLGTKLPGPGSIYVSQDIEFTAPIQLEDTVTAIVKVKKMNQANNRVIMETICTNQKGEIVLEGEAELLPPKN